MEPDYCGISPFGEGELTDSSSEQSSTATTPTRLPVESFQNIFNYPPYADTSKGLKTIHGLPAESRTRDYAWVGHSGFNPTSTKFSPFPSYSESASGIGKLEAENGLDQVPRLTTLFEGVQSYPHYFPSPTTWDPNCQTVTGLLFRRSAYAPSNPTHSTAHGQPWFVPFEGAAPLASLAPQPDVVPSEPENSGDDADVAIEDFDVESDGAQTTSSKAVQTLPECYCPFGKTITWARLHNSDGVEVPAKVFARFRSKSLDKTNANKPHYITYRRNYFSNEMWFELEPPTESADGKLYVDYEDARYPVQSFSVLMRAVNTNEQGEDVEISVFTPKRDRPIAPTPTLEQRVQPNMPKYSHVYNESTGFGSNKLDLPTLYTCVHNQFRQATKNNGSRRKQQSYYRIVVELRVIILGPAGGEICIKIASTISGLLVVRGRCPGSFADDPNHQKKKPRKVSYRRRDHKAVRPTKKKGQSRSNPPKAPEKVRTQRTPSHTVNSAVPSTMPSLTSDSRSCADTTSAPFSAKTSPQQMSPRDEIRNSLSLPISSQRLLPAVPGFAGSMLTSDQWDEAFKDEGLAFDYEIFNPMASEVALAHKRHIAPQLDQYRTDLKQQGYVDLRCIHSATVPRITPRSTHPSVLLPAM